MSLWRVWLCRRRYSGRGPLPAAAATSSLGTTRCHTAVSSLAAQARARPSRAARGVTAAGERAPHRERTKRESHSPDRNPEQTRATQQRRPHRGTAVYTGATLLLPTTDLLPTTTCFQLLPAVTTLPTLSSTSPACASSASLANGFVSRSPSDRVQRLVSSRRWAPRGGEVGVGWRLAGGKAGRGGRRDHGRGPRA